MITTLDYMKSNKMEISHKWFKCGSPEPGHHSSRYFFFSILTLFSDANSTSSCSPYIFWCYISFQTYFIQFIYYRSSEISKWLGSMLCLKFVQNIWGEQMFSEPSVHFLCVMQALRLKHVSLFGTGIKLCFRTEPEVLICPIVAMAWSSSAS